MNQKELPSNKDIYMRHGEFEGPREFTYEEFKKFLSDPDSFPLSKHGKEEIKNAFDFMPDKENISLILTSPYARSKESAEVVRRELKTQYQKDVLVKITKWIREIEISPEAISEDEFLACLRGGGIEAVGDFMFEKWRTGQAGETPQEVEKRIRSFLKYLRRVHKWTPHEKLLIVSHASFGRALRRFLEHRPIDLPRNADAVLETSGHFYIARNPSKERGNLPGVQEDEFIIVPSEELPEDGD